MVRQNSLKISGCVFFISLAFFLSWSLLAYADTVYLKSAEKIEGKIFKESPKKVYLILDTEIGLITSAFSQEEIEKIEMSPEQETEEAEGTEKDLIGRYSEFVSTYRSANKFFDAQQYYDAMESYRKAVEVNPKFPEVHYNLGLVYCQLQFLGKAKESFETALSLAKSASVQTDKIKELISQIEKELIKLETQTK